MRNSARVTKLYNKVFYQEKYNTPYFIIFDHKDETGYYISKDGNKNKRLFKTQEEAKEYIYSINQNPLIIIIDFHNVKL